MKSARPGGLPGDRRRARGADHDPETALLFFVLVVPFLVVPFLLIALPATFANTAALPEGAAQAP
ncbi:hypothetical protein ACWD4V_05915 [Streptomyces tsukubensis]|uniref:hypothetical protein n=1 Tax=Streptomyces tsukubensis TaxID=83656 RepID=UPI00367DF6F9